MVKKSRTVPIPTQKPLVPNTIRLEIKIHSKPAIWLPGLVPTIHGLSFDHLGLNISTFICQGSLYVPILVEYYIHMSNEGNDCNTNLVLLRFGLAEGCAKPSLPIGDDPIPLPLFCMSRFKVQERRHGHHRHPNK